MNKRFNKPCNFFQNGSCKNGDNCQYLHLDNNMNMNGQSGGQNKINKQCGFYASGKCKKGENCEFLHGNNEMMTNSNYPSQSRDNFQSKNQNKNICRKFMEGKCGNDNCNYLHRYNNNLDFMTKVPLYDNQFIITGICKTPNSNSLITSTENKITIWELPLKVKDEKTLEGKITNLLFSNYKLIVGTQISSTFSPKSLVFILLDDTTVVKLDTETRKINDIIEIMKYISIGDAKEQISIILIAGEGFVEVWGLRKSESQKITTLSSDDHSEVLTLAFNDEKSMLFAGYKTGNLAAWQLDEINFKFIGLSKLHNDAINKIVFHRSNFLISCSSDTTVKIYDLLNDKIMDLNLGVQSPIINLYLSKNYENEDIFLFVLKNLDIVAYKDSENGFLQIFTVPSLQGSTRFILDYENPKKDKITGDYILFTDGDVLDINAWESQTVNKENFNKNNNFQQNQNFNGQKHNKFNTQHNNQQYKNNSNYGGYTQNRGNFMGGKRGQYN